MTELLTKRDAIEMIFRPIGELETRIKERMMDKLLRMDSDKFLVEFKKSTDLTLEPFNNNRFVIKY
jgi:hypothetical protein